MSLFHAEKSHLSIALDVGSRTIKGIVFEISDKNSIPKAHKRIAIQMPSTFTAGRIVGELHNVLAKVIKEFGHIPSKVIAGFGTSISEYRVEQWDMEASGKTRLSRKDMAEYFSRLLDKHGKEDRAMIATPAGIEINGYAIQPEVLQHNAPNSLFALGGTCRDIRFRTVVAYFPYEIGTLLANMKQMLGGVPIEFIPLASAYEETLAHRLKVRDALLIDIGGTSTMLMMLKDKILVQTVAFPFGISHISQEVGRELAMKPDEAMNRLRQYGDGLADDKMQSLIQSHLVSATAMWSQYFRNSLDFLYPFGPLTGETYLCGGGAYLPELRSYVEQSEWLKPLSYIATPRVTVLEGKSLLVEGALKGFLRGPEDAGLASVISYGMHHEVIV